MKRTNGAGTSFAQVRRFDSAGMGWVALGTPAARNASASRICITHNAMFMRMPTFFHGTLVPMMNNTTGIA